MIGQMHIYTLIKHLFPLLFLVNAARAADTVSIVATGETHAMTDPCDCPVDPGGGIAERATVIRGFTAGKNALLLDAGGFSGGGIYDSYTEGRKNDSLRTLISLQAMGASGYDAVAIGDDDLQYGALWLAAAAAGARVNLVSANCFLSDGKPLVRQYVIVERNGVRFGITGLTTQELILTSSPDCTIADPLSSLRKIWPRLIGESDAQIIISHLGEEMCSKLAASFPECDLIVNGHRKNSQEPLTFVDQIPVLQFAFEGKKVSYVTFLFEKNRGRPALEKSGWLTVSRGTVPAPDVAAAVSGKQTVREDARQAVYDLYIMSQCLYGCQALGEFVRFAENFPGLTWNLWFIGSIRNDSLISLRGKPEIADEMVWLAVRALYPDNWLTFLRERARDSVTTASICRKLALDSARISRWVRANGKSELERHYTRSIRLAITASPTLLMNNTAFAGPIESRRLAKTQCPLEKYRPALCDSLPECFKDSDCRKRGSLGRCAPAGRCEFMPDAAFVFTVLVADSTLDHPEEPVIATTEELFPNVTVKIERLNGKNGRELYKRYAPPSLPFYLFDSGAVRAHNFFQVESGFRTVQHGFTFNNGITSRNYFPLRRLMRNQIVLYIDPLLPDGYSSIAPFLTDPATTGNIRILPMLYANPGLPPGDLETKIRAEESLRWLLLDSLYRPAFFNYLERYFRDPGSSYWFQNLIDAGVPLDSFTKTVSASSGMLSSHWNALSVIGGNFSAAALVENQQLVVLKNQDTPEKILHMISAKGQKK